MWVSFYAFQTMACFLQLIKLVRGRRSYYSDPHHSHLGTAYDYVRKMFIFHSSCLPVKKEQKKKSWQSMGHPGPEREIHALAQSVNIAQPHREVITFWELSTLCIIIL